ncbi:MAG: hypothetical protein A3E87_10925 [Gammaproteobacteria bacterium RIFCSPHIGHO2_12_FULL_35_23]|nr:MAG: hypothetical protein A3E87_10925 [Gammaproteobacteria bacterium RIFCSPHIGHO2_12_FULL_35_23]
MIWLNPIRLPGDLCIIEPLSLSHHDALTETVKEGELWSLWYTTIPKPEAMQIEIKRRLELQAKGLMLPFTIIEKSTQQPVGMTSYLNLDAVNCRLEIGATWLQKSMQRTGINTETKLLLLTHVFEIIHCNAVEFRTNSFNQQSRKAIERLGAKLDGILRNHMVMANGLLRDTCVYSIIANEWPSIKTHLRWLLKNNHHKN